jgi:hypothetical protein
VTGLIFKSEKRIHQYEVNEEELSVKSMRVKNVYRVLFGKPKEKYLNVLNVNVRMMINKA